MSVLTNTVAALVKHHGSLRKAAKAVGTDHVYLHRILKGAKSPSATVLKKLGLERVITYRKESP